MPNNSLPNVVSSGELSIAGQTFTVYVLDNGKRVFEKDDFDRLLKMVLMPEVGKELSESEMMGVVKVIKGV